ncbi:hypothetical protein IQ06DRAFT_350670 [Phaeosphaeriaceae sp. SRC1lsM3a]|nr:hypothetical protein IQ06DRAFT_350670 [Stagonospora sp. SRC1lsM3a]
MKHVSFTPDTKFDVGRLSKEYLRSRGNNHYHPGAHSASNVQRLCDTSFVGESDFNCLQLKVFVGSQDEVDGLLDTFEAPPRNEGIVAEHRYCDAILQLLEGRYDNDDNGFLRDLKGADWVLLTSEGGVLLEVVLHETWELEDMEWLEEGSGSSVSSDRAAAPETERLSVGSGQLTSKAPPVEYKATSSSKDEEQQPQPQARLQAQGVDWPAQTSAENGSAAIQQLIMPALKSCLKKRPAQEVVLPSAPKRARLAS